MQEEEEKEGEGKGQGEGGKTSKIREVRPLIGQFIADSQMS